MRASEFPIPDYAAYVWDNGNALALQFADGHTLFIPYEKLEIATTDSGATRGDQRGWEFLRNTLRERRTAYAMQDKHGIGTLSEPVHTQMEALLRGVAERQRASRTVDIDLWEETV